MVDRLQGYFGEIPMPPEGMEAAKTDHAAVRTEANRKKQRVAPTKARGPHPVIAGTGGAENLLLRRFLSHRLRFLPTACFVISNYCRASISSSINIDVAV
jgi:hypothetical protein